MLSIHKKIQEQEFKIFYMFHNVTSCDIDRDKFDDFNNLDNHCLNNAFYTRKIDV